MKFKVIFGALLMTTMTANASLTGSDLAAANAYLAHYPEISSKAPWIKDSILGANSLQQANDQLKGNSYYNGTVVVFVNQISALTSVPALTLTDPSNAASVSETPHLDGEHPDAATLRSEAAQHHYAVLAAKRDLRVKKEEFNDVNTPEQATNLNNSTPVSETPHLDGEHPDAVTLRSDAAQRHYAGLAAKQDVKVKKLESDTDHTIELTQDIVNNNANALAETQSVVRQNARVSTSNSQRLDNVESHQEQQDRTISDNKKHASAGISAAFAQANIPQVTESQRFSFGAGVGTYNDQQALAVGASFHASQNTIVKLTVSDDTQSNVGAGAGIAIGW